VVSYDGTQWVGRLVPCGCQKCVIAEPSLQKRGGSTAGGENANAAMCELWDRMYRVDPRWGPLFVYKEEVEVRLVRLR
jgi:hypothetical protein